MSRRPPKKSSAQALSKLRSEVSQGQIAPLYLLAGEERYQQERALQILQFKLDVLWQMNDALALRYGTST